MRRLSTKRVPEQGVLIEAPVPTLTPEVLTKLHAENARGKIGRPYGSKNKRKRAMEEYLSKFAPEVLETLIARAIAGDHVCLALYMERVYPKPNRVAVEIENVPAVKTPDDARAAMAHVIQQAMAGELAGDEAADVMEMLAAFLQAHSIHAIAGSVEANGSGGKPAIEVFNERLAKIKAAAEVKRNETEA